MAFLRFSRDKRGYENFYLVETSTNRRGKTRARVLYWFRTPPGVKVGREPFDAEIRRALEVQNPNVVFDWRKISETPIPSADAEKWRERRRFERAERGRRRDAVPEESESPEPDAPPDEGQSSDGFPGGPLSSGEDELSAEDVAGDRVESELLLDTAEADPAEATTASVAGSSDSSASQGAGRASRRRRRRRRRGGPRGPDRPRDVALEAVDKQAESKEPSPERPTADSGNSDDSSEV
ncbi:MAG TPA: hypothetical protein VF219_05645 [Vicinamibacterales bacterium]